jgi:hypothetical protein
MLRLLDAVLIGQLQGLGEWEAIMSIRTCLFVLASGALAGCGGPGPSPTNCVPGGQTITHTGNITSGESWSTGIHAVPSTIYIRNGARLTIDACSTVQLGPTASLIADTTASGIDANGTETSPVLFTRQDVSRPWGYVQVTGPASARLAFTTLEGGGSGPDHAAAEFQGASLVARGDARAVPVLLTVGHLTVRGSGGLGVFLQSGRFDGSSHQLVVTGSGWYPVYGGLASAASLPDGAYTGNAIDQILLQTVNTAVYSDSGPLLADANLHDRGVPYRVGTVPSSLTVGSGRTGDPAALLTIDPNVTILFTPQGTGGLSQLRVNGINDGGGGLPQGALLVQGTPATPVTFDSAADVPAPGDWQGLYFANFVDPRTLVSGARILDAGGFSGSVGVCESAPGSGHGDGNCAVDIFVASSPTSFLQGSFITNSAGCGVYRGWQTAQVDFEGSNQFSHVPGCVESNIPDFRNACPLTTCDTAL